ncbi:NAD-binding protein [Calocera viscosa TUFC12733]|uniref:NAD-binding protein n=1 Tax=Calocera viscosa (strain TUFC12733) TaxID=1330018 RepID=A0A167JBT1_CALVF|nr:NAD-binding protein [Calocera viscosa TUFC12733]
MSGYKNFAVVGAGLIGKFIIDELLKEKAAGKVDTVVVLTRSAGGKDALAEKGAKPIVVDYSSSTSLQSALHGIDVVISTIDGRAIGVQEPLSDAAKAVGVKLFVPSEFAGDTINRAEEVPAYAPKNELRKHLEQIGLPWAAFFTGPFSDWILHQAFLGFDIDNGKVEVSGTGDGVVSWTSRIDIARYVVYATTVLPPSKLHNRVFKIQGERTSLNKVLAQYQVRTGKKVDITYLPLEEVEAKAKAGDVKSVIQLLFQLYGEYGTDEEMNVDWPDFNPQTGVDAILSYKA